MADYDSIDLDWTWDGDYIIGDDGDFLDTSYDFIQSLKNELRTIVRSEFGDWELHPGIGGNMSEYRGEPNTREVGIAIEDRLRSSLVGVGIVRPEDVQVRVIPVGKHQVMATLVVQATSTVGNSLEIGEPLAINLLYDSLEDSVFFLDERDTEME